MFSFWLILIKQDFKRQPALKKKKKKRASNSQNAVATRQERFLRKRKGSCGHNKREKRINRKRSLVIISLCSHNIFIPCCFPKY